MPSDFSKCWLDVDAQAVKPFVALLRASMLTSLMTALLAQTGQKMLV